MDNCRNTRANTCWSRKVVFIRYSWLVNHNNLANRGLAAINHSSFCPIMLSMVVYWTTMALTGNGELGFDSGEGAGETATTSKEGSRRVNSQSWIREVVTRYSNVTKWRLQWGFSKPNFEYDWRTSLVPAPAVIPAPIAYIKVVAVKKLVVGFLVRTRPYY